MSTAPATLEITRKRAQARPLAMEWLLVAAIVGVAAFLRMKSLGAQSFWFDESFSVEMARLPWRDFLALALAREANMTLYYAVLRAWMIGGTSEAWIRGLSAVIGTATVVPVYVLGRKLYNGAAGMIAALLLAFNAFHIVYSRQARGYALAVFLVCVASLYFLRVLERHGRFDWVGYGIFSALAIYTHLYCALMIAAQVAVLAFRRDAPWADLLRGVRLCVYLCVPLAWMVVSAGTGELSWVPSFSAARLGTFAVAFSGNAGWLLPVLLLTAAALAVARSEKRWGAAFAVAWFAVPIAVVLAVSLSRPLFEGRYLTFCLPGLLLAAGIGGMTTGAKWLRIAAIVLVLALSISGLRHMREGDFGIGHDDWRSVMAYLNSRAETGDRLVFYAAAGRLSYEYYNSRQPSAAHPMIVYPAHGERLNYRDFLPAPLGESLPAHGQGCEWLVLYAANPSMGADVARRWCAQGHRLVSTKHFNGVDVLEYRPN